MLTHFLNRVVQALAMLRLRNRTMLQKTIEKSFLIQEQLMILLCVGKRGPVFDFNIHNNQRLIIPFLQPNNKEKAHKPSSPQAIKLYIRNLPVIGIIAE